ncbi:MAG: hypothetical protein HeimC2_16930 [Candidatus Heimdallarchaeota archaeon LC_2]|nr:MAG: hypothetical protein HeimC2_16930 [Candidatus Heimdallarchaeota archaeon LC_2]
MAFVRYLVFDVEKSVKFYTSLLGFELKKNFGRFAMITKDDLEIWVSGPETTGAMPMPNGDKPVPGGWNRIVVVVENINETVDRLKSEGVVFLNEVLSGVGGSQVLIEDPSGNPIEIFEWAKRS